MAQVYSQNMGFSIFFKNFFMINLKFCLPALFIFCAEKKNCRKCRDTLRKCSSPDLSPAKICMIILSFYECSARCMEKESIAY